MKTVKGGASASRECRYYSFPTYSKENKMRKTIQVEKVRNTINSMIGFSKSKESKSVLCTLVEEVLFDTGNYNGFKWDMPLEDAKVVTPDDDTYYDRVYF